MGDRKFKCPAIKPAMDPLVLAIDLPSVLAVHVSPADLGQSHGGAPYPTKRDQNRRVDITLHNLVLLHGASISKNDGQWW